MAERNDVADEGSPGGDRLVSGDSHVVVIGLGYIGLPTASALASAGLRVTGVDNDATVVAAVRAGSVAVDEPGLAAAVSAAVADGRLSVVETPCAADVFVVAVPTPLTGCEPDLTHVRAAVTSLAPYLRPGNLVVLESTVPPGTTAVLGEWLRALRPDLRFPDPGTGGHDVCVAHCPERVLPGRVMEELVANDRIVGGLAPHCADHALGLYQSFVKGAVEVTDSLTAETAKLVENAFRDVNIAFANEIANACTRLGLDPWSVIGFANRHPRVQILNPGPGVGGHCIAVDPWFLVSAVDIDLPLIRVARQVNDARRATVAEEIEAIAAGLEPDAPLALLGLAFKADVSDLRGSPALFIAERLTGTLAGRPLLVVEPHLSALPTSLEGTGARLVDLDAALAAAGAVVLLVDHAEFRALDPARLAGRPFIDTRNAWPSLQPSRYPE